MSLEQAEPGEGEQEAECEVLGVGEQAREAVPGACAAFGECYQL